MYNSFLFILRWVWPKKWNQSFPHTRVMGEYLWSTNGMWRNFLLVNVHCKNYDARYYPDRTKVWVINIFSNKTHYDHYYSIKRKTKGVCTLIYNTVRCVLPSESFPADCRVRSLESTVVVMLVCSALVSRIRGRELSTNSLAQHYTTRLLYFLLSLQY